jgi:hypothetical protein
LGKPNFSFQKRQREIAKMKKQEEKRQKKLEKNVGKQTETSERPSGEEPLDTSGSAPVN